MNGKNLALKATISLNDVLRLHKVKIFTLTWLNNFADPGHIYNMLQQIQCISCTTLEIHASIKATFVGLTFYASLKVTTGNFWPLYTVQVLFQGKREPSDPMPAKRIPLQVSKQHLINYDEQPNGDILK